MVLLISGFGMTALVASATRRAMQLTVAVISLGIFMATNLVDYRFGIIALVTALIWLHRAHMGQRGNKFVINLFAAVSILLALQLLLS